MPPAEPRRYDAVICDIDGCLSPESSAPMDLESLARIATHNRLAALQEDRPLVTLCSGRPQPFVEAMCRLLANDALPCIGENGVWLWDPRDNGFEMDPTITQDHIDAVRELSRWARVEHGDSGLAEQAGKSASLSFYHPDPEALKGYVPQIEDRCQREGWPLRISMTWFYINCDLQHISKATGVARLVQRAGLNPQRLAGIGDTMSDEGIRSSVAWFASPANAHPDLKARADYVAATEETEGVLEILGQIS